jgi:hypothetical protein
MVRPDNSSGERIVDKILLYTPEERRKSGWVATAVGPSMQYEIE